jgi:predicted outer membrane repeat protein
MRPHESLGRVLTLALLAGSAPAPAAVHRVPSEYATIQAAIDASAGGDSVIVAPGTYTNYQQRLFGTLHRTACVFLKDGVVLASEGGPTVTTIDMMKPAGVPLPNVIYGTALPSGSTVVEGFTITGVPDGNSGVFVHDTERVTIRNCIIRDMNGGTTTGGVGARYTDVDVIDCEFVNLTTITGSVAGLGQLEADVLVDGCVFTNCVQRAIACQGANLGVPEQAVIRNSVFIGNAAISGGGAGAVNINDYEGGVTIEDCYFEGNSAVYGGGAIAIGNRSSWTVQNCTFWRNTVTAAGSGGGALFAGTLSGSGTVVGCTFEANGPALQGGAVYFDAGAVLFSNNVISGSLGNEAVYKLPGGGVTRGCNLYWNNAGGNAVGFTLAASDRIIDPEYCDASTGDLTVFDTSPCLPANSGGCGLIGAHDQGCGSVSVERTSWGRIKGGYR